MRPATDDELARWNEMVAANPDGGQILQTREWGEFKARWGWRPLHAVVERPHGRIAVLFLRRRFPGLGEMWYAPKGPGVVDQRSLVDALEDHGLFRRAFLVKVEPEIDAQDVADSTWCGSGLRRAPQDVQVNTATILVDLRRPEEAILASFKPKTRYNVRLAARRGVRVRPVSATRQNLDVMYRLMAATQRRAGFPLRPRAYFDDYWGTLCDARMGEIFFAVLDGEVLAGAFVTRLGARAWYKDGGSSARHRELMAPHLLQWEVMRRLRGQGVTTYDLVAVPPRAAIAEGHPLYGLYRFKSGFCDTVVEYAGTLDLPLRELRYAAWDRAGERIAHRVSWGTRRNLLY